MIPRIFDPPRGVAREVLYVLSLSMTVGCGSNSVLPGDPFLAPFGRPLKAWFFGFLAILNFGLGLKVCFLVDLIEARSSILPIAQHTRVVCRAMGAFFLFSGAPRVDPH